MARLYVIQTGRTTWEAESRVDSAAGAPLTREGIAQVKRVASEVSENPTAVIYASPAEAEFQTAALVADVTGVKVKAAPDLRELDFGLWQGLTIGEIKRRHGKLYRQWLSAPANVRPPGGETIQETQDRIAKAVVNIIKRNKDDGVVLILRPVALGLLRCLLDNESVEMLWDHVDESYTWGSYEMAGRKLQPL